MKKRLHQLFKSFLINYFPSIDGYQLNEEQNTLYVYIQYRSIDFDNPKTLDNNINIYDENFENYDDYEEIYEVSDYDDKDYTNIEKYEFSIISTPKDIELIDYTKFIIQELNFYFRAWSIYDLKIEVIVLYS
jgi:hypothetical protein